MKLLIPPINVCPMRGRDEMKNERLFPLSTLSVSYTHLDVYKRQAKRIYQGGEESDAAFFVYFADTVRLQQLVNASAFFVCQVVSGDVLYVEADGLL